MLSILDQVVIERLLFSNRKFGSGSLTLLLLEIVSFEVHLSILTIVFRHAKRWLTDISCEFVKREANSFSHMNKQRTIDTENVLTNILERTK